MHGDRDNDGVSFRAAPLLARLAFWPVWLAGVVSALMVLFILGLITVAVAARYFLNQPLPWADDLSGMLLVAMVAFGMAEAMRRGDHIAIDLVGERASRTFVRVREIWATMAVLAFTGVLLWSTWGQVKFAREFGSYTPGEIEIESWIPMAPLVIGWLLLGLAALGRLVVTLARPVKP